MGQEQAASSPSFVRLLILYICAGAAGIPGAVLFVLTEHGRSTLTGYLILALAVTCCLATWFLVNRLLARRSSVSEVPARSASRAVRLHAPDASVSTLEFLVPINSPTGLTFAAVAILFVIATPVPASTPVAPPSYVTHCDQHGAFGQYYRVG